MRGRCQDSRQREITLRATARPRDRVTTATKTHAVLLEISGWYGGLQQRHPPRPGAAPTFAIAPHRSLASVRSRVIVHCHKIFEESRFANLCWRYNIEAKRIMGN